MFDRVGVEQDMLFGEQIAAFLKALKNTMNDIDLVSNETGLGVVVMDKKNRHFIDEAGLLHQRVTQLSDRFVLMTTGLQQVIK